MCGGPRLPAPSTLQVRAGRLGGRAGCRRAKTRAPPHRRLAAAARRLPLRWPLALPGRAERSASRWGRAPLRLPGHLRPPHRAQPRVPRRPYGPSFPEGRSYERDVELSSHRRHSLPVRRGLGQWLHQHFGVSEPSSRGSRVGRGRPGPRYQLHASFGPPLTEDPDVPSFKEQGNDSPLAFRERKLNVCPGRSWCFVGVSRRRPPLRSLHPRLPSDSAERLPRQVVPGRGQVGSWVLILGKASGLDATGSRGGAELLGVGTFNLEPGIL